MITVKLGDVFQGTKILMALAENEMTAKTGYKLNKVVDSCVAEMPKIEKSHNELVTKYSGGTDTVLSGNTEVFIKELNDFLQTEVELLGEQLIIEEIEDCKIKPFELKIIAPFLK